MGLGCSAAVCRARPRGAIRFRPGRRLGRRMQGRRRQPRSPPARAPPQAPWLRGGRPRSEDFARHDFVGRDRTSAKQEPNDWPMRLGAIRFVSRSDSDLARLTAAEQGQGICCCPIRYADRGLPMQDWTKAKIEFGRFGRRLIEADFSGGDLTSDGGLARNARLQAQVALAKAALADAYKTHKTRATADRRVQPSGQELAHRGHLCGCRLVDIQAFHRRRTGWITATTGCRGSGNASLRTTHSPREMVSSHMPTTTMSEASPVGGFPVIR